MEVPQSDKPRVHHIAWHKNIKRTDAKSRIAKWTKRIFPFLHQVRDERAFTEVASVFMSDGFQLGVVLLNLPADFYESGVEPSDDPVQAQGRDLAAACFSAGDLMVTTTRLPLGGGGGSSNEAQLRARRSGEWDHGHFDNRRAIGHSWLPAERAVLATADRYFDFLNRGTYRLATLIRRVLNPALRDRAWVEFLYSQAAWHKQRAGQGKYRKVPKEDRRVTTAFLMYEHRLPTLDEVSLLSIWGMGGSEGLVWARLLRTRFPDLLRQLITTGRDCFLAVEFDPYSACPERPEGLGWVSNVTDIRVVARFPEDGWATWITSDWRMRAG